MSRLSLKYRIAVVIFCLEGIMMAFVLGVTLSSSLEANRHQLSVNETVLLDLLADLSRIALFTSEYDDLQPYIEQVTADPHVIKIIIINRRDRVVASSDVLDIGAKQPALESDDATFWRTKAVQNDAGNLGTIAIKFSHSELLKANRKAFDLGISIALAGMTTIAIIGIITGFLLTRRLDTLTQTARRLADGDLEARTRLSGHDEIAMVGQTFDDMAENIRLTVADLHASKEELRRAHDDLELRISERTAELAVARDQAMDASRAKGSFIANMSHELRTPLNAIIGYSEILKEDAQTGGQEDLSRDLSKIHSAGTHLLSLINDVLDLSKIEAGKMELNVETFCIREVIQDTVVTATPLIEKNENTFELRCDENIGTMYSDPMRIRQTLLNLLSNAAKFTDHGKIRLDVTRLDRSGASWIYFSVIDSGLGIDKDKVDKLFHEFTQADSSTTRKYGGTGLGLAISRRFCQMMGGDITVQSEPDHGSTFTVKLPALVPLRDPSANVAS